MAARPDSPRCGRLVMEARRRHGLSQQELAERTGIPQTNISRIERDKISPSLATLERLFAGMGETLRLITLPVNAPPPGGGNVTIRDLRADFDELTPDQRLEQAALLSRTASELATGRGA
ncbi:MAG: helix-turn-helix domain-containing protein [Solirubrobacterales bacterium]